jgi:hypothetical protein
MPEYDAGWRRQSSRSSTTFRTTRLPPPDTLGLGWFRLESVATVRLARLTGGLALLACNQSSTRFTARLTWDGRLDYRGRAVSGMGSYGRSTS